MERTKERRSLGTVASIVNAAVAREILKPYLERFTGLVNAAVKSGLNRIDTRLAQVRDGRDGAPGAKGEKGDTVVGPRGPKGDTVTGPPGPPGKDGENAIPPTLEEIFFYLKAHLTPEHFVGFEQYIVDTAKAKVRWEGGAAAVAVMQSGKLKVNAAPTLNFKGAGAPTVTISQNGVTNLDFPSSSGGGGILPATGTVDGSNTVFVFTTEPTQLIVDGVPKRQTQSDGTVNWTGTTTITLAVPPNFDIYGIS